MLKQIFPVILLIYMIQLIIVMCTFTMCKNIPNNEDKAFKTRLRFILNLIPLFFVVTLTISLIKNIIIAWKSYE